MRKGLGILLFVMTLVVMAYGQNDTCGIYLGTLGPYRCPNPGCHEQYYVNRIDMKCVAYEECDYWIADTNCCGAYTKWVAAGYACLITEICR